MVTRVDQETELRADDSFWEIFQAESGAYKYEIDELRSEHCHQEHVREGMRIGFDN